MNRRAALLALTMAISSMLGHSSHADDSAPLVVETKIPLGAVRGRIDHLAVDRSRQRLFIAELGNDSVGVVDLAAGKLLHRITGLSEPQGVGYEPATDTLYLANAGDGSVRLFTGDGFAPIGTIELGSDADNVRIDPRGYVVIGHGDGALAIIDAASKRKVADIPLAAHPESFQLGAERIFVNLADRHTIAVIDRGSQKQIATWLVANARANFPMALDEANHRLLVVFRRPPLLVMLDTRDGRVVARLPTCGDADDLFIDRKRQQIYVSCGEGTIDVFGLKDDAAAKRGPVATVSGARTSLFLPERDRLYLAVRASGSEPAAIWVMRPSP